MQLDPNSSNSKLNLAQKLDESIQFLRSQTSLNPDVGIILGSGLGSFGNHIEVEKKIPYHDIPHFGVPSIEGHSGNLIFGKVGKTKVVCLQGRIHFYEGHTIQKVSYPTRVLCKLGIKKLFITNAAGGLDTSMEPGDFMIIQDHINLMGVNPLIGPNDSLLGPRFPDMTEAYSSELNQKLALILTKHQIRFHNGTYIALTGPTYETPSEVRYLKMVGGSAVGMSTVPETIVANHMGIQVCGVSCITNKAAGLSNQKLSHAEVTEVANRVEHQFVQFVKEFIGTLDP